MKEDICVVLNRLADVLDDISHITPDVSKHITRTIGEVMEKLTVVMEQSPTAEDILPKKNPAVALASAHWSYVKEVIESVSEHGYEYAPEDIVKMLGVQYRTAFIHGHKHGVADTKK